MPAGAGHRPGRFDGFDAVGQVAHWDPVTAGVVLRRLGPPPPIRFFTPAEEAVAGALFDQLLGQRDEPKVPVVQLVDARLAEAATDGWRYEDMPEDGAAWRVSLANLDTDARRRFGAGFAECDWNDQSALVQAVQDRGADRWHGLPAAHVWSLWTRYACTAFYGHPWAWNEMGFGGPAYPRGYRDLGVGRREPYEEPDRAPDDPTVSAAR